MKRNRKYDEYLVKHINATRACRMLILYDKIREDHFLTRKQMMELGSKIHDFSKWSEEEYEAYAEYFYPSDGSKVGSDPARKEAFTLAWWHHQKVNTHHWQFYLCINSATNITALEMPIDDVVEMVCDWGAFAWISRKPSDLRDWYEKHKDEMILHPATRERIEKTILPNMVRKLEEYFENEEG